MDINNMTLEQKAGQMIIAGFPGENSDEHIIRAIKDYHIGVETVQEKYAEQEAGDISWEMKAADMIYEEEHLLA